MSASKPVLLTRHARRVIEERELELSWIEQVARAPEWAEPDPSDADIERRFGNIPERDNRVLRVAVVETIEEIRIISAFLDHRARKPK